MTAIFKATTTTNDQQKNETLWRVEKNSAAASRKIGSGEATFKAKKRDIGCIVK